MEHQSSDSGWIEVITGSMFSGKSEELIRRLRRAQIARQKVQIFKPAIDLRYSDQHIISHSEMKIASQSVKSANEILAAVEIDSNVVGIDEGQFFDQDLVRVANILADLGKRVIVAGLDMDYLGRPFEPMPLLLPLWKPGGLYAATDSEPRTRGCRRRRVLRGPLPRMLRPASVREGRRLTGFRFQVSGFRFRVQVSGFRFQVSAVCVD